MSSSAGESDDEPPEAVVPARPGRLYRGEPGAWPWVAHRITGVLTFFFLFAHVLDTALVRVSPNAYDKVVSLYKNPLVNLLELVLVGAVLYHALNGLRVTAIDFWSSAARVHRGLHWAVMVVWIVAMIPTAYFLLRYNVEQLFGGNGS